MMKKNEHASIEVGVKKPKVVQLNKGLIMALIGIVFLVFILIIVNSYSKQMKNQNVGTKPATLTVPSTDSKSDQSLLNQLPAGYQDAPQVEAIVQRSLSGSSASAVQVQQEMSDLKNSQAQLMQEVSTLKQQKSSSSSASIDTEASHSAIFFAGAAPIRNGQNEANPSSNVSEDSKNATTDKTAPAAKASSTAYSTEYQSQNMQTQKTDFLNTQASKDIYNQNGVQYPLSKFIIQAGTIVPAVLQTQIISSLPGMITAIASQNVYDSISGQYLIIPKGSKLLGQYNSQISYGQEELQAKFTRIIRPDGSSITLGEGNSGVDRNGVSGFSDSVNNHWGSIIGSAVMMTIFNIPEIVATNQMNRSCVDNGNGSCTPSMSSTVVASSLQSASQSVSQVGSSLVNKSLNIQPTITIHPGYQFSVMVTKDTILPPYQVPLAKHE